MATSLKRPISTERPLLIIIVKPAESYEQEGRDLVRLWDGFDDFLRHHVTVQIEGILGNDFERCEKVHLPLCRSPDQYYRVLEDLDSDHGEGRLIRATNACPTLPNASSHRHPAICVASTG